MGLFDLLLSSVIDRRGTMDHLLMERPYPPYIISSFLFLVVILVLPSLWYQFKYGVSAVDRESSYAIATALGLTFILFTMCTTVLLRVMGMSAPVIKVVGAITYSLVALIPFMLGYYIADYAANGQLAVLSFLATGQVLPEDRIILMFPSIIEIALFFVCLVFVYAVRALANCSLPSALLTSVICIPLLVGCFTVAATCSAKLFPNTVSQVWDFLPSLLTIPEPPR